MVLDEPRGPNTVRVLDFGLARLLDDSAGRPRIARTGATFGTVEYMAPEQIDAKNVGPPADLYSLGVVLYEGLAGRPPFSGTHPVTVMMAHREEPVPRLPDHVHPALAVVVHRALAKSPAARFATAREMAEALRKAREQAVQQSLADTLPDDVTLPPPRAKRRRRVLAAAAAVCLVAAVVALLATRLGGDRTAGATPDPVPEGPVSPAGPSATVSGDPGPVEGRSEAGPQPRDAGARLRSPDAGAVPAAGPEEPAGAGAAPEPALGKVPRPTLRPRRPRPKWRKPPLPPAAAPADPWEGWDPTGAEARPPDSGAKGPGAAP